MASPSQRARELRRNSTDAERVLWRLLRAGDTAAHKFLRQAPIGRYIVDFGCFDKKIVIEVDGGQHQLRIQYDRARTEWLESQGFKVLRFWNNEVMTNEGGVLDKILSVLQGRNSPSP